MASRRLHYFLRGRARFSAGRLVGFAAGCIAVMAAWGAGLEGRSWARPLAVGSLLALGGAWPLWVGWQGAQLIGTVSAAIALMVLALRIRPAPQLEPTAGA